MAAETESTSILSANEEADSDSLDNDDLPPPLIPAEIVENNSDDVSSKNQKKQGDGQGKKGGNNKRGDGAGGGSGRGFGNRNRGNNQNQGNNSNRNQKSNRNQNSESNDDKNRRDNRGGGGDRGGRRSGGYDDFQIIQKLKNLQGPCHDVPSIEQEEILFSGRNRLYVGNLPDKFTEKQLINLFEPYGKIDDSFVNVEKNFAFCKVDHRTNAEQAKRELDGTMYKNRTLRVRFAPNSTAVRVKNLTPFVSNELLHKSFEVFGKVERAVIVVDERGKPIGEGLVEFAQKSGAMAAIRYCTEKCYFLTTSLRPCICELFENMDDNDGCPEKTMNKKTQDFFNARRMGPRFAHAGSFEHEYGTRWKQVHELYKQKMEAIKKEMELEEEKLEAQMDYARYEHETEMLRERLRFREMAFNANIGVMLGVGVNNQMNDNRNNRQGGGGGRHNENVGGGGGSNLQQRINRQNDDNRRQQENALFMQQAQQMGLLDLDGGGIGHIGLLGAAGINMHSNQQNFGQRNFGGSTKGRKKI